MFKPFVSKRGGGVGSKTLSSSRILQAFPNIGVQTGYCFNAATLLIRSQSPNFEGVSGTFINQRLCPHFILHIHLNYFEYVGCWHYRHQYGTTMCWISDTGTSHTAPRRVTVEGNNTHPTHGHWRVQYTSNKLHLGWINKGRKPPPTHFHTGIWWAELFETNVTFPPTSHNNWSGVWWGEGSLKHVFHF